MKTIEDFALISFGAHKFKINGYIDTLNIVWNEQIKSVMACCLKEDNVSTLQNVEFKVMHSREIWPDDVSFREFTYKGSAYNPLLKKMYHVFVRTF